MGRGKFEEVNVRGVTSRRVALVGMAQLATAALVAACSNGSGDKAAPKKDPGPVAKVGYEPGNGSADISPVAPVSLTVTNGRIDQLALTNPAGKQVSGTFAPDRSSFKVNEPLGYGITYTWSGTAIGTDNKPVPIEGKFSTLQPRQTVPATINIGDGQTVGIAASIILQFKSHVANKAAVERALTVTTTPETEGGWAWLPDDNGGSRAHWRPRNYWAPGTDVTFSGKLYGLDLGDGGYGNSDLTSEFKIGRSQIVQGHAPSHRVQVVRDGQTVFDFPCSYGEGNEARNVTRSGIHVVTEKYEDFVMSNPPFYTNARERWAVRISNNGEFIHANPESASAQGNTNVTNGCINLSTSDAQAYFPTAIYGDPVEVTGTSIALSAADGDIYDWTIDWDTWKTMSALHGEPSPVVSATPLPPAPVGGN
ncbi:L,D-transpeptidase family protein [Nocardia terpenica]|uniref:L,D-transpeptidase n=1 Tax=Nocardia terpenica TaxID=455432 RepID=UPI0018933D57|nr:L,D-transpeptidase family protein [Nocardia terpenica]MBF6103375.1 L,D-transpeptidase family protein [Nocardia terpenica]MBF6112251.1 L,D-transpeptidase family protein [Nocardia terpenica]MBF6117596.1 L,D-transpeptidase family protein [Nocardia terpenica]MBF6153660.1 L,D-transpeptidase family protein [Nocardia terpenica]